MTEDEKTRMCEIHMHKIIHIMKDPHNDFQHRAAIARLIVNFEQIWTPGEFEINPIREYFIKRLKEEWELNCIEYDTKTLEERYNLINSN